MRKPRRIHIYCIGVAILGGFIAKLQKLLDNDPLFLAVVIAYCLLIRLISEKYGRP